MPQAADTNTAEPEQGFSRKQLKEIRRAACEHARNKYLKPFIKKARIIAQTISPFLNLTRVFYAGVPDAPRGEDEDGNDDEEDEEEEYTEEEEQAFKSIMKLERAFPTIVDACSNDVGAFLGLIHLVCEAAGQSRGDDSAKLKTAILEYLYDDPKAGSRFQDDYEIERLIPSDKKHTRGFCHLDTADLLCPLKFKAQFEEDPVAFTTQVLEREIRITHKEYPCFMYASGTVYNPNKELKGFLQSEILVKVFRHIYTGPSSASHPTRIPNKTKAKKFGLTKVTGRMIAYTAVQTYLGLSSAAKWTTFIDSFNLDDFYDGIVRIFEQNKNSRWMKELIEWWQERVPGLRPPKHGKKKTVLRQHDDSGELCQADRIQAELDERERRLAQRERELAEKEHQLKQQVQRTPPMITPPRSNSQRSPPSLPIQRSSTPPTPNKRSRTTFEGESEGESEPPFANKRSRVAVDEDESSNEEESDDRRLVESDDGPGGGYGSWSEEDDAEVEALQKEFQSAQRQIEIEIARSSHSQGGSTRNRAEHRAEKENSQEATARHTSPKSKDVSQVAGLKNGRHGKGKRKNIPEEPSTQISQRTRSSSKRPLTEVTNTDAASPPKKQRVSSAGKKHKTTARV